MRRRSLFGLLLSLFPSSCLINNDRGPLEGPPRRYGERDCTCPPGEGPVPCAGKYALQDCLRMRIYTAVACAECGAYTMEVTEHGLACDTCGATRQDPRV